MSIQKSNPLTATITETRLGEYSNVFIVNGYQIVTQIDRGQVLVHLVQKFLASNTRFKLDNES